MRSLLILISFLSSSAFAEVANLGTQVLVCAGPDNEIQSVALLDLYEGALRGKTPNLEGNTDEEKFGALMKRLSAVNPSRAAEYEKRHIENEKNTQFVRGADLIATKNWDDSQIPVNCKVKRLILRRIPRTPLDKSILINADLWERLDLESRAAAKLNHLMVEEFKSIGAVLTPKSSTSVRELVSELTAAPLSSLEYFGFAHLVFQFIDFHGGPVKIEERYPNGLPKILRPMGFKNVVPIQGIMRKVRGNNSVYDKNEIWLFPDLVIQRAPLESYENFQRIDGKWIRVAGDTFFDHEGHPLKGGIWRETFTLKDVTFICAERFEFYETGELKSCVVQSGPRFTGNDYDVLILGPTEITFSAEGEMVSRSQFNYAPLYYFDFKKNAGEISGGIKIKDLRRGSGEMRSKDFGDYVAEATTSGEVSVYYRENKFDVKAGEQVNFYDNANLSIGKLREDKKLRVDSRVDVLFGASARCSWFTKKTFDGDIRLEKYGRILSGVLAETQELPANSNNRSYYRNYRNAPEKFLSRSIVIYSEREGYFTSWGDACD